MGQLVENKPPFGKLREVKTPPVFFEILRPGFSQTAPAGLAHAN